MEWRAFQVVANAGGRAACQDDFATFRIMRESQFAAWSEELRQSYREDLLEAERTGRNLPEEKYARMMRVTAPGEYETLKPLLPPLSAEAQALAEEVCDALTAWQFEFATTYPFVAANGRPVREDGSTETSFAVYLMAELLTYSLRTLALFADYVRQLQKQQKNLSLMTMEHMAARYGYRSLDDAEATYRARNNKG